MAGFGNMLVGGILTFGLAVLCCSTEKVKFPKDQRTDLAFPVNIILPSSPGLPIGHLRPLGKLQ